MRITILLFMLLSIMSCGNSLEKDNIFEPKQKVFKSPQHIRVKGTKLFAAIPKEYTYNENLNRYQIDKDQHIKFFPLHNVSWDEIKKGFNKKGKFPEPKKYSLQNFDGFYYDFENPNSIDFQIHFGSKDFAFIISAKGSKEIPNGREKLLEILRSLIYDEAFNLDEFELANFTFNRSILDYQLITATNKIYVYSQDRKTQTGIFNNSILFETLPVDFQAAELSHFKSMIRLNEKANIKFKEKELKTKIIGDYEHSFLQSEIEQNNKKGLVHYAIIKDARNVLAVTCIGFDKPENLSSLFSKTIESISFK